MKVLLRLNTLLCLWLLCCTRAQAQVPATINVPSSAFPDFATVIDSLNLKGVGPNGTVITLLPPATVIQAPAGGFHLGSAVLNASTAAKKSITIRGNGHTIKAPSGIGSVDGIFFIEGVDYLTIDSLNLAEDNAGNTTDAARMEWGYALLKRQQGADYDGCQYVTITRCTVTMDSANKTAVAAGIYAGNHLPGNTTSLTLTSAAGTNSNNTFSANVLQNLRIGISLNGYADPAAIYYDQNNTIGGSTAALGNKIRWFGSIRASTTAEGIYLVSQDNATVRFNNINNSDGGTANNGNLYGIFAKKTEEASMTCTDNTISLWQGGTSGKTYGIYSEVTGKGTVTISRNTLHDFNGTPITGTSTTGVIGMIYTDAYSSSLVIDANKILNNNITNKNGGTSYIIYIGGKYSSISGQDTFCNMTVTNNIIDNYSRTTLGTGTHSIYVINLMAQAIIRGHVTITGNTISNISNDKHTITAIRTESNNNWLHFNVSNNVITGLTSSVSSVFGVSIVTGDSLTIRDNTISNLSGGKFVTALEFGQAKVVDDPWGGPDLPGTKAEVSGNNISDILFTGTGSATLPSAIGIKVYGGAGTYSRIYNNFISDLRSNSAFSYSDIAGMNLNGSGIGGKRQQVFYNTIYLGGAAGITGTGATGIQFSPTDTNILYNNIIHVNVTAGSGNSVAVLRRDNAGTAGTPVALPFFDANNNIYYAPSGPNNYLYVEGTSNSGLKNGFALSGLTANATNNMVNDPDFNTSCGKYKSFLLQNRETGTFTEKNLAQIGSTATYAPSGASYAEGGGAAITAPAVTTDYAGATRSTPPDIGALQFNGTAATTPPVIVYTSRPVTTTYCTDNPPTITATITAAAGGVNTSSGTRPRLYYKKSSENNAFGNYPADNASSFNGWKYVESTNSGSSFSFAMDYSKFSSPLAPGDSVTYFIIAEDNAPTPNVVVSVAGFSAGCGLPGVNLNPSVGSTAATPVSDGFKVLTVPANLKAVASQGQYCTSGVAYLHVSPVPPGNVKLQWQEDHGNGSWADIIGATDSAYTSGTLSSNNNYRIQIRCGGTAIATSAVASITIQGNPTITSSSGASRCGSGTVKLVAKGSGSAAVLWYDALTGGAPVHTGDTFTTPVLSANRTYYATAFTGLTGGGIGASGPGPNAYWYADRGLYFEALAAFTLQSVAVYPIGTGQGTVTIRLTDTTNNVLQSKTVTLTGTSAPGSRNVVPLNFLIPPGRYVLSFNSLSGSITQFACNYGFDANWPVSFPYLQPGVVSINSSGYFDASNHMHANNSYYYFYDWSISIGCESTPRQPVTATVIQPPAISVSAAPDTSICGSRPVDLTATSVNSGYTYDWMPGTLSGAQVTVTPSATTTYYVTATDNSGGASNGCVTGDSIKITVRDKPLASFAPTGLTSFCEGDSVELHAGSGPTAYQWQFEGADIPGATSDVYVARDSGNYSVWVSNPAMCNDTSTPLLITVYPLPVPTITQNGNVLSAPAGYTAYWWQHAGSDIPGATSDTYTVLADGDYTVRVTDGNSCEGVSALLHVTVQDPGGIAVTAGTKVHVYPNPARTVVYIDAPVPVSISLFSMEGRQVMALENERTLQLDMLPDGVYMIRVSDREGRLLHMEKLIKSAE